MTREVHLSWAARIPGEALKHRGDDPSLAYPKFCTYIMLLFRFALPAVQLEYNVTTPPTYGVKR